MLIRCGAKLVRKVEALIKVALSRQGSDDDVIDKTLRRCK